MNIVILFKFFQTILNLHLLWTHIWLRWTNQTTYEWIVKNKQNKVAQDTHFNEQQEDENINSHSIVSKSDRRANSLRYHRSKIVHKRGKQ